MPKRRNNVEIVRRILREDMENILEDEDIIHLLLNRQVSENLNHSNQETVTKRDRIADCLAEVAGCLYWELVQC